jgi:hypothetical protein
LQEALHALISHDSASAIAASHVTLRQPLRQLQLSFSGVAPLHVLRHSLSVASPHALSDALVSEPQTPFSQSVQLDVATLGWA